MFKNRDTGDVYSGFWLIYSAVVLISGMIIGGCATRSDIRQNAVKNGAAHWVLNEQTGDVTFEWIGENKNNK